MGDSLSLRQRFLLEWFRRFRKNETILHPLRYLFWECTLRCNLLCRHCGSDCLAKADVPDMPAEDFLGVTELISHVQNPSEITVVMTGGEPLLRSDLADVGRKLRDQGYRWSLVTNGYNLTHNRLNELANAGLGAITVSLDGLATQHNWLRNNPDSFRRATEAIRLVARNRRLNADVVTCVNQRNINLLPEIQEILGDTGIRKWRLFTITPIGRAAGIDDLSLSGEQLNYLLTFIEKNRKSRMIPEASFSCESYLGNYEGKAREGFFFCRAGIHIGSILADGGISACPNIDRNLVQGNIYRDDFNEIWDKRFLPFRNRTWTKIHECSGCGQYRYCEGNGMHWWDYEGQRMYGCNWQKAQSQSSVKRSPLSRG
ncbi:MAG: TIGR04133 family radical SAM/SPASM protein [Bacteroidales bacterium]